MQTTRIAMGAAFAAALLLTVGCEDTPLTPGEDFTMSLVARPAAVLIDATHPEGQTSIVATVFSDTGLPQPGITVIFSSNGGVLGSGNAGLTTDGNGNAVDTLTMNSSSPAEVTVTANAGTLVQTVKVNKTTTAVNRPPTALIVASPPTEQAVDRLVTFDGSTSTDPDLGDGIQTYAWSISSSNPDPGWVNPVVATTPSVSFPGAGRPAFANAQILTVNLVVTDQHGLESTPVQKIYPIKALICGDNQTPTARIAGAATQTVIGTVNQTKTVTLDGSVSTDPEGPIETYVWTCGNGAAPVAIGNGSSVTCDYVVQATSRTYTPTLVVKDQGFGPPAFTCQQTSASASIQLIVTP